MARSIQSQLKRAREQALREKRERKEDRKAARAASREAGEPVEDEKAAEAGEALPDVVE
jgi:hypothetical protein